jgi:hypothetical protein
MRGIIEQDYVQANLPTMESYLLTLMYDTGITGEELASVLECPVEQLYELLTGVRTITSEDIATLEQAYANASHTAFVVGCQMMTLIQNIG